MKQKNYHLPESETDAAFAWNDPQHTHRFQELVQLLLSRFFYHGVLDDIPETDIPLLARIAALHDIGKLWLPAEIVNKSGSLTPEETALMRKHTLLGASFAEQALRGQEETSEYTYFREICRHHHERWDGNGYPDGLRENETPRYVQIIGMADALDALMTRRSYRPAMAPEDAIWLVIKGGCGIFSPQLRAIFEHEIEHIVHAVYFSTQFREQDEAAFLHSPQKAGISHAGI